MRRNVQSRGLVDGAINTLCVGRMMRAILVAALFLLAGCSGADSDGDETPFDGSSYTIVVTDLPAAPVMPGETFTFKSTISGARTTTSDHIGGHFGTNSTGAPTTTFYQYSCQHTAGELPGEYQVTCTAPGEQGVFYLRGHARIGATAEEYVHWWSEEHQITIAGPVS